jgi:hypothetical protein
MGIADYVSVCVLLYRMLVFHCLSLHISAYMAIFRCVGFFIQTDNKERASRQTHTQGNNENNEGKQHRNKSQMENMQSVTT